MNDFLAALHWLGTKPLTVSLFAQGVALLFAWRQGDKSIVREHVVLMFALVLIIVSLSLRPPSPLNLPADIMGTVAAVLLLAPAVQAIQKSRKKA